MSETPTEKKGFVAWWQNTPADNTKKTLFVAVSLCLFCSMIVSIAAVSLRPIQDANKLLDKQRNILQVAGVYEDGIDVRAAFNSFEPHVLDLATGTFTDEFDAVTFDDRAAASDPELSIELDDDPAGIGRQSKYVTVYFLKTDDGALDKVILPIYGYGLWSTLYGFIALEADGNGIYGLQFYEHGETPGLGAEVDNPRWKSLWNGKMLHDDGGDLRITVAKGSPSGAAANHHVDALAGATLTSQGVDNLVRFWMGEAGFAPFLENLKNGEV